MVNLLSFRKPITESCASSGLTYFLSRAKILWGTPITRVYIWVKSPNGHLSFKQETYIYLVNSSFWKQVFGALNPVPLFVSLLLCVSVKEKNFAALLKHSFVYF